MIIRGLFVALAVATFAVGGCASTVSGTAAPQGAETGTAATDGNAAAASTDGPPVDACSLLKPAEITTLLGPNDGGKGGSTGGSSDCEWTNAAEYSVSVHLAQLGTAPNGLPAWDPTLGPERPLPGGMRSWGQGDVQFVAKTRDCHVQVVDAANFTGDDGASAMLAKLLQTRI